jgi:putative restriction endonuclease
LTTESGKALFSSLENALHLSLMIYENSARYGEPMVVFPRLGQGAFRILVTDAYQRRCAITNERTLPALDAAHIKPFSVNGPNEVKNGILLRRDLHALFDKGYITITPSFNVEVSRKIKEEFENGKDYYKYHGERINLPFSSMNCPSGNYLEWHNSKVYKG